MYFVHAWNLLSFLSMIIVLCGANDKRSLPRTPTISATIRDLSNPDLCIGNYYNPPLYAENSLGVFTLKLNLVREHYNETLNATIPADIRLYGDIKYNDNRINGFDCGTYGANVTFVVVTQYFHLLIIPENDWLDSRNQYVLDTGKSIWNTTYVPGNGLRSLRQDSIKSAVVGGGYEVELLASDIIPSPFKITTVRDLVNKGNRYVALIVGKSVISSGYVNPGGGRYTGRMVGPWYTVGSGNDWEIPCDDLIFSDTENWNLGIPDCDYLKTFPFELDYFLNPIELSYMKNYVPTTDSPPVPSPQPSVPEPLPQPQPQPQPQQPPPQPPSPQPQPVTPLPPPSPIDLRDYGDKCYDDLDLLKFMGVDSEENILGWSNFTSQRFPPYLERFIVLGPRQTQCVSEVVELCPMPDNPKLELNLPSFLRTNGYDGCKCECRWNWQEEFISYLIKSNTSERSSPKKFRTSHAVFYEETACRSSVFDSTGTENMPFGDFVTTLYRGSKCDSFEGGFNYSNPDSTYIKVDANSTLQRSESSIPCEAFSFFPYLGFWEGKECELEDIYYEYNYDHNNKTLNALMKELILDKGFDFNFTSCSFVLRPFDCRCSCETSLAQRGDGGGISKLGVLWIIVGIVSSFIIGLILLRPTCSKSENCGVGGDPTVPFYVKLKKACCSLWCCCRNGGKFKIEYKTEQFYEMSEIEAKQAQAADEQIRKQQQLTQNALNQRQSQHQQHQNQSQRHHQESARGRGRTDIRHYQGLESGNESSSDNEPKEGFITL